jgi:Trypsin
VRDPLETEFGII